MAKLILTSGEQRQEFELAPINTIGRHPDNSIQILDRIISKEHAQILRGGDGHFLLRDLGSLNGTYVGGSRVSEVVLKHGDELVLGSTHLTYVEHTETEESLNRVTIAPSSLESRSCATRSTSRRPTATSCPRSRSSTSSTLRRDYEKLRIAHELGRAIVGVLDLEQLLPRILDKAFELLPADRGVILLYDQDGKLTPRYVKHKHRARRRADRASPSRSSPRSSSRRRRCSRRTRRWTRASRGAHSIIMQGIRSTMCVPLLHGDELLGIMHMDSQIATNAFTEKDLQLFTGIAGAGGGRHPERAAGQEDRDRDARRARSSSACLSPNLVEQLVAGKLHLEKGGELREVTILISDIRGFTSMSEKKEPAEIVQMLNEYFEVMVDILFRAQGTLDKYVGDEIMALFGAPVDMPDAPLSGRALRGRHAEGAARVQPHAHGRGAGADQIGIGINTGRVITGAIGSSRTLQYTAIGDAVNTASRLCSIAKAGEIILSESTMRRVRRARRRRARCRRCGSRAKSRSCRSTTSSA